MYILAEAIADAVQAPSTVVLVLVVGFIAAASIGSIAWFSSKRPVGWKEGQSSTGKAKAPGPNYDRGIVPAETAARQEREGANFKQTPTAEGDSDTAGGYTVDREGHVNNYAVEPEMYVEERGDLQQEQEEETAERAEEIKEVNEPGGKGPGVV